MVVCCVLCSVDMLGPERSLRVLRFALGTIIIVNCISILVVPQAVHLPGEFEGELAGNWRGMHYHKNNAGAIAALTALIFFHHAIASKRMRDWLVFVAAVFFLVGTQSKTATGFFAVSLIMSTAYRFLARTELGRQFFMYLFVSILALACIGWLLAYEEIADLMSDPGSFTGRVAIWQTTFTYLRDHWLLGSGFGSFWLIGDASPTTQVTSQSTRWIQLVAHSHNGYLEILVTTGAIGLLLSVIAFVIIPTKQLVSRGGDVGLKSLLLSVVFFVVLANLLETAFLSSSHPEWVIFLVVLAILHQINIKGGRNLRHSASGRPPW
jgi:O-antigen ligase